MNWQAQTGQDIISSLLMASELSTLPTRARNSLVALGEIFREAQSISDNSNSPAEIIEKILDKTGYTGAEKLAKDEEVDRSENLSTMVSDAKNYADLATYLEDAALMSSADTSNNDDNVTLMTLHAAKGLEFPVVFMTGMEEGLFPHSRVYDSGPDELEEERRLCYVGMTRAREELILSYANRRAVFGQWQYSAPSRFITDAGLSPDNSFNDDFIDEYSSGIESGYSDDFYSDEPNLSIGDKVRSSSFGKGIVTDIDGMAVEIRFDNGKSKKLNIEYARLEKI
jgi:DNA helicase-2/ATP-dependent DNA helicase PcrA